MPIEIKVPRLGWSMEEGGFVGWLKKSGDAVKAGEPLFTLEGDKATQDVEATDGGVLYIPPEAPAPGSPVVVGKLLGYLLRPGERPPAPQEPSALSAIAPAVPTAKPAPEPSSSSAAAGLPAPLSRAAPKSATASLSAQSGRRSISPRALRTAMELGVDWTVLRGSGRSGRIREKDVLAAATQPRPKEPPKPVEVGRPQQPARALLPANVPGGTIVITDWTFADLAVEEHILKPLGVTLRTRQCRTESELIDLVSAADVVITQFGRLNRAVIGSMRRARAIVRYGIGVDNIDLEAAREHGIPVANVPDYCIDEVADQTLAFILALTRQVVPHHQHVKAAKWGLVVPIPSMHALAELTVGVVGFGRIGRAVVQRLAPFHPRILVFDPVVSAEDVARHGATPVADLDALLPECDLLTLHCPSTPQTRRMINASRLARLKPGALLVNVARGDIVDTPALVDALGSGQVAGAALDVCDPEPIPSDHPILKLPNVILAPHVASVSEIAVRTLRETVATLAALALACGLPPNVVNGVTAPRPWTPSSAPAQQA